MFHDFDHKVTKDGLWLDGYTTTPCVEEEFRRRGLEGVSNQGLWEPGNDSNPDNIVRLLKSCAAKKDLCKGSILHEYVREHNCLGRNTYVGNSLVCMYAKCGALDKACQVLKELPMRNVVSWNAIIAGYAQQGQGDEALKCFDDMLCEGHSPSAVTFISVLKACGSVAAIAKGKEIHDKIVSLRMLEKNAVLGITLVDMYAKCGDIARAHLVLKELPMCDVASWTALIAGHTQQGQGKEALKCFDDMLCEGHRPNAVTFICVLKACGSVGAIGKGEEIHDKVVSLGMLEKNIILGNTVVDMYAKCGQLTKAHRVLKELPMRDVVSWNLLIAGYVQHGQGKEALKCFDDMLHEGHSPDAITFTCALKVCGSIRAAARGEEIHNNIVSLGLLKKNIVLGNTLVDMYAVCGELTKARSVLKELPMRDTVSWTALIAGHAQHGQGEEALRCFDDMLSEGHSPDAVTFACALKACGTIRAAAKGEEIHDKIVSLGMLEKDIVLRNTLVDMYVKCGELAKANEVLKELPMHDVSWHTLIAGYVQHGRGEEALKCFDDMLHEGHSPDAVVFASVLKACGRIRAVAKGEEVHKKIVSLGILQKSVVLGISLIDMYAKCGELAKAYEVLKGLPMRDVVSWTALIAGHAQQGQGKEALKCFDDMIREGHSPNAVTLACVLKVCGSIGAAAKGEEIHDKIVSLGMLEKDVVLGTTLVDMYIKYGELSKAHKVLKELPMRDVVSWNVLIAGYAQHRQGEEALKSLDDMLCEGHSPNAVTFICVLKACGSIGATAKGEEIHSKIANLGMLENDVVLRNTLVDMYVKCGALAKAQQLVEELLICDVVCCSTLIAGYAQQGQNVEAINCFEWMQSNGVKPDLISMSIVLHACSHSGLLDQAETYFSGMSEKYGIYPSLEHHCCMIDVFGRAGKINKALSVIAEMPNNECLSGWVALLGACCKWAMVNIGTLAFEHALNLDKCNAAVYVLMADIYTAAGMQEAANAVELLRATNKAW